MWNPFKKKQVKKDEPIFLPPIISDVWIKVIEKNPISREDLGIMGFWADPNNHIKLPPEMVERNRIDRERRERSLIYRMKGWLRKTILCR